VLVISSAGMSSQIRQHLGAGLGAQPVGEQSLDLFETSSRRKVTEKPVIVAP
jgi:hypothetical protein